MQISILIPVFNGLDFTKRCISNLKEIFQANQLTDNYELIVIDDGSKDGTSNWLSDKHPEVICLRGDGNLWWSGSINLGMEYVINESRSHFVLWWNNDIEAEKGYFTELLKILSDRDKLVVGSKIYDLVSKKVWGMGGRFNTKTGKHYQQAHLVDDSDDYNQIFEADWLPGMGTVLHIDTIKEVGLLDAETFPQYHGDLDYTLRCKQKGFSIKVFPSLIIYNDTANSGLKIKETFNQVLLNMRSIKSFYNLKKDILLYKKHTNTPFSYYYLFKKYGAYIGGFIKWKLLSYIHISKNNEIK